jgi:hypothetical protein
MLYISLKGTSTFIRLFSTLVADLIISSLSNIFLEIVELAVQVSEFIVVKAKHELITRITEQIMR